MAESENAIEPGAQEATTSIDAMLQLLREKGKLEVGEIAVQLGKSYNIVEKWATVLEGAGVVTIRHELGKVYVVPSEVIVGERPIELPLNVQITIIEDNVYAAEQELKRYASLVKQLKYDRAKVAEAFRSSKLFSDIAKLESAYSEISRYSQSLEQMSKKTQESYLKVSQAATQALSKVTTLNAADSAALTQRINETYTQAQRLIDQKQRELNDLTAQKIREMRTLRLQLSEESKNAQRMLAQAQQVSAMVKKAIHDSEQTKRAFMDKNEQLNRALDQKAALIALRSKELTKAMDEIKSSTSEAVQINEKFMEMSTGISEIDKQLTEAAKDISALRVQLGRIKAAKSDTAKRKLVQETKQPADDSKQKITEMKRLFGKLGTKKSPPSDKKDN